MLDYLERERGIKREILLEAVSNALLSASKKSVGASRDLRIDINPKSGEIRALANLLVVEDVTNPQDEIELSKARKIKPDANIGDDCGSRSHTEEFWAHRGADRKTSHDAADSPGRERNDLRGVQGSRRARS